MKLFDDLSCWLYLFIALALSLAAIVWDSTFAHTTGRRWEDTP